MRIPRLLCCLCLCLGLLVAAEGPTTPGLHENVPCVEQAEYTIDLFLPAQYDQAAERCFPVFFLSSPGGNPSLRGHSAWADERGFILVALNNSKNGPWGPVVTNQDLAWKSLEFWGIKAHHCLRYAGGFSGAAWASVKFSQRYADQFAGVHLSGHSGNGDYAPKHVAISFFAGLEDTTHPISAVRGAQRQYGMNGNPVLFKQHKGGHQSADAATMCAQIDWMYLQTVLQHPQLTKADIAEGEAWLAGERSRVLTLEAGEQQERLADMLSVAGIRDSAIGEELLGDWAASLTASVQAAEDAVGKFWLLYEGSQQPWYKKVDRDLRKDLGKQLKTLKKDKAVKKELSAWAAFAKAEAMEDKANTDKKKAEVAAVYAKIAETFPETRYGIKAGER